MTNDNNTGIGRRTVLKGAGTTLASLGGIGTGIVGAARPNAEPSVSFNQTQVMRSPAGLAIPMSATLPEGGYIAISVGDSFDPAGLIGVNPNPLGKGTFPNMLIRLDPDYDPGEGISLYLTAALFKDNGNHKFDPADFSHPYGATATENVTF